MYAVKCVPRFELRDPSFLQLCLELQGAECPKPQLTKQIQATKTREFQAKATLFTNKFSGKHGMTAGKIQFLCPALFHIPDEIRPFEDPGRVVHSGVEDVVTF